MKRSQRFSKVVLMGIILFDVVLFFSIAFLMNRMQTLLETDIQNNLTEVVTQNKDVITSKLDIESNNLKIIASSTTQILEANNTIDDTTLYHSFSTLIPKEDYSNYTIANTNGLCFTPEGVESDVSGRRYFQLSMQGIQNISEKIISRFTGDDVYVISTPLYYQDTVIGTVQKKYTTQEMLEICSLSSYSSMGYMYIVNKEGYTILNSDNKNQIQISDNFFRDMYETGNEEASLQFQKDIPANKSGFLEYTINNVRHFATYTPISNVHDWYLITSVPVDAMSPNTGIVINIFYFILFFVLLIFTSIGIYFYWSRNKQRDILEKLAFVDPVTKGHSYNKFVIEVEKTLLEHPDQDFYILKFDIDNFKYVNNYFGFEYGDKVLASIYRIIHQKLIDHEIISRVSNDEYVVFLEDVSANRITSLFYDIREYNSEFTIYCSGGIYKITDCHEPINIMIDKARTAAQTIKGDLNQAVAYYDEYLAENNEQHEQLKQSINQAIKNDEFVVYYQPKVNINTGVLTGGEALVRWIHEGKLIPPDAFIPMCEKTGIIVNIDIIVFHKVIDFLQEQLRNGIECVPISVNFSRLHLQSKQFLTTITDILASHNIPHSLIEIELTESAFFNNMGVMKDFIDGLHQHDLKMAMDDFGSGYSSLNMLKEVSIDILKIDKAFLSANDDSSRQEVIFSSIADMALKLGIEVVVEGVETIENVDLMKRCNCEIAQGYYYARPMKEEEFIKIIKEKKV